VAVSEQGLAGLRVVEIGGPVAAPAAGKLFADLGATVVKIEPPAGDPARQRGPFRNGASHGADGNGGDPEASGTFLYLNTNKRSLRLDLREPAGRASLVELAAEADLLLHDVPTREMAAQGLDYAALSARNPRLVMVSITPFGLTGPYRDWLGADLPLVHGGGLAWLVPDRAPPPDKPPLRPYGQHALMQAGLHAAVAGLAACHGAAVQGVGEHVDVAVLEVVANLLCRHFASWPYTGSVETRLGRNLASPATYFPCKDGMIYLIAVEPDQWERLVALMDNPPWATPEMAPVTARGVPQTIDLLEREIAAWTLGWEVQTLTHACQAQRIGAAPVYLPAQLAEEPHLLARGFWRELTHPRAGTLRLPGPPYVLDRPWWALRRPAPALGEADAEAAEQPARLFSRNGATGSGPPRRAAGNGAALESPARPLAGVRVLDLTWVWAGPHATQMLAFLGAEVIKVESSRRPDLARRLNLCPPELGPGLNRCAYFNQIGIDKRSAAINLQHPEGLALAKRIAAASDVVVSNFATGVLERLGLGVSVLQGLRDDLIVANLSAYGQTGPYRHYTGYGPAMVPLAGLGAATGYEEDDAPQNLRPAYADPNAGIYLAFAVLAGLEARRRRGGGLVIDVSLWEALTCTGFEGWMGHVLGGEAPHPLGNHDPQHAPHNVYRCAGDDEWLAVAVTDDTQWAALCRVLERPELAADANLRSARGRKAQERLLDEVLAAWCAPHEKWQAAAALQAAGVPAFPSLRNREVAENEHLRARGYLEEIEHPEVGRRLHTGVPWRLARRPNGVQGRAPLLGEHTDAVLTGLLDLDTREVARLREVGAIE
jgi:crotonobetainyl-CoA:carnitine CoA-transferase CaiB-like acyl-CoA transferase